MRNACLYLSALLLLTGTSIRAQSNPFEKKTIAQYVSDSSILVESVIFKKVNGKELSLLVAKPGNDFPVKNRPVLVWIHGGGWSGGNAEQFLPHIKYSAARGAVGISVQYRLIKKEGKELAPNSTKISDALDDCADAIKYIRKHAKSLGIDADKIIVIGDSAGGHLALSLGFLSLPKKCKANVVINCNGIADMQTQKWIGNIEKKNKATVAKLLSPIEHIDKYDAIVLNMNGDQDHVVEAYETEKFHNKCLAAGVDSKYILWSGMRHAFILTGYTATDKQITKAFLAMDEFLVEKKFLKGETSLCY